MYTSRKEIQWKKYLDQFSLAHGTIIYPADFHEFNGPTGAEWGVSSWLWEVDPILEVDVLISQKRLFKGPQTWQVSGDTKWTSFEK